MEVKVFVINLSSEIKRRSFQEKQLHFLGLDYTIIQATTVNDIDEETYTKHYHDWQRPLRKTEVACYYSHRRCWQKVVSNDEAALILEDDALLSTHIHPILSHLKNKKEFDLVDLEVTGRKKNVSKDCEMIQSTSSKLYKLHLNSSGAGGYVISPNGAKKLLEHEENNGISLADAHIASCYELDAYQLEPAAVIQFIICPLYNIPSPEKVDCLVSTTNLDKKENKRLRFRLKRIFSQLRLGFRKLYLSTYTSRRYIHVNKSDFE